MWKLREHGMKEHGMKEHGKTEEDMIQMKDKLKDFIRTT
jgi:hypothetical protein